MHALRAAGYDTALAGKMHFIGPDQLHGFEERLTTDIYPWRRRCHFSTSRRRCWHWPVWTPMRWPGPATARALLSARGRPVISGYHGEGVQAPSAMVRSGDEKLIVSLEDPDLESGDPDSL